MKLHLGQRLMSGTVLVGSNASACPNLREDTPQRIGSPQLFGDFVEPGLDARELSHIRAITSQALLAASSWP